MKAKINPTRQELLKLKKRLKIAKSGHKLLKEKLDGLMREFFKKINDLVLLRKEIEKELPPVLLDFFYSSNTLDKKNIEKIITPIPKANLRNKRINIMGVWASEYEVINEEEIVSSSIDYSLSDYRLALSKKKINLLYKKIIDYASLSLKIRELAIEIEKNRRRVNSLKYVYIPEVEKSKKYIGQKLEEGERFERTVSLKLKSLMANSK